MYVKYRQNKRDLQETCCNIPYSDTGRLFYQADLLLFHHGDLSSSLTYSNVQCVPIVAVDAIANVGTAAQPQLVDILAS